MFQKTVYSFILILLGVIGNAQTATIKGIVKDEESVSIPDVQIAVLENGSYTSISNSDGTYSINVPSDKNITLSFYSLTSK